MSETRSSKMKTSPRYSPSPSNPRSSYIQNILINKQLTYIFLYGHLLLNSVSAIDHNKTDIYSNTKSNIESYVENNIIDTSDDAVFEIQLNPKYHNNNLWLRNDKQMFKYVVENVDAEVKITSTHAPIKEAVVNGNVEVNENVNYTYIRSLPAANITTINSKVIHTRLQNATNNINKNSTEPHVEIIQSDKNIIKSLANIAKVPELSNNMRNDNNFKSNTSFIDTKSQTSVKERNGKSVVTDVNIDTDAIGTTLVPKLKTKNVNEEAEVKSNVTETMTKKSFNNSVEVTSRDSSNSNTELVKIEPCNANSTNCPSVVKSDMLISKKLGNTSINNNKTEVFIAKEDKRQAIAVNSSVIVANKVKPGKNFTKPTNHTSGSDSFTITKDIHEVDLDSAEEPSEDYDTSGVSTEVTTRKAPTGDPLSAVLGFAGSVAETVVEKVLPKWIVDIMKRMQEQNTQLETIRLRSREENGGIGQFGRNILKSLSTGLYQPLNVWIQGVRDFGSLDSDKNFFSGVASGVVGVADGVVNMASGVLESFKDRVQAIYPGTLWCGDGHMAREQELGLFFFTDTCCRQHDECKLYIASGETRFGLTNTGLFTRSHCSCDDSFRACLKRTGSLVSSQIGLTFFNVLGPQCFRKAHPIVRCVRRTRITGQKCEQYELDRTKPKMWQWFDNETF